MGANEKGEATYPRGPAGPPAGSEVIGFYVQCETCPQRALLRSQTTKWQCPRCTEASSAVDDYAERNPYTFRAEAALYGQHREPPLRVRHERPLCENDCPGGCADPNYCLRGMRG